MCLILLKAPYTEVPGEITPCEQREQLWECLAALTAFCLQSDLHHRFVELTGPVVAASMLLHARLAHLSQRHGGQAGVLIRALLLPSPAVLHTEKGVPSVGA